MGSYGQHTDETARAMAGVVARPGTRVPGPDLPVVLGCRDAVAAAVAGTYRHLTHANPGYPATLSGLETDPVNVLGGLLARQPRVGASEYSPTELADHTSDNPVTLRWQQAARAATLASHEAGAAGVVWHRDTGAAWKGVADLAALAQALPVADRDLAEAAEAAGWAEHGRTLRAAAGSGIAVAGARVEALARSEPVSARADEATRRPSSLTPAPVRDLSGLGQAQRQAAAQLRAAAPPPSLHVVTAVATGQARATVAAADMLGRNPDYHGVAAALRDRADNLTGLAAARTRISSIYPGRGDVRAAQQTGEVMRTLETARARGGAGDTERSAPHLLAFASAGSEVVTALDDTVSAAASRGDYVVPGEGLTTAWARIEAANPPPLLTAAHNAADGEQRVTRAVDAAYERTASSTAAARPTASRAAAELTRTLASRQARTGQPRPASPLAPPGAAPPGPAPREERDR